MYKLPLLRKRKAPNMRGKLTTIGMADLKPICYATRLTSFQWQTNPLFETHCTSWYGGTSFETRKSMAGSAATF